MTDKNIWFHHVQKIATKKSNQKCTMCENRKKIQKFTCPKSHISRNLHFQNRKLSVIHIFKITFQMPISSKIAFSKSHFSHKSQFRSRFFTKIAFPKFHFSQKSHYFKYLIYVNLWIKSVILPQCVCTYFALQIACCLERCMHSNDGR